MATFMNAREGDYIEDINGIIFDVKGLIHPPNKIIAFPRFIPADNGERKHGSYSYNKIYSLSKRFIFLQKKFPQYLTYDTVLNECLCEVPTEAVKNLYQPLDCLQKLLNNQELDKSEKVALQFMELLNENSNVPWSKLGVSGSIMVGLHTPSSDIDPVIYGSEIGYRVYSTLKEMLADRDNPFEPYEVDGLRELFDFRSKDTAVSFEDFVRTDSRKVSHGKFMGRDFFIRFVKDWNEVSEQYGNITYKPEGRTKIKATVADDAEAIFTPCSYKLADVKILEGANVEPIEEIVSFRGRFCEQAKNGETVISAGKVERVQEEGKRKHYRLLIGNKPSDYMILYC
jgi:predicted nucleotidyltransferase